MASYEMKQGNSFWMDYTMRIKPSTKTIADIDPVWANFSATWRIEAATGEKALAGELTRATTAGVFNLRIGPISSVVGTGLVDCSSPTCYAGMGCTSCRYLCPYHRDEEYQCGFLL
jgi:hypothetical protein